MTGFPSHFFIGQRRVGPGEPCLVIAEAGVNHFGSLDKAFRLVDMAVGAKADVFKLQHFRTDELVGAQAPEWRERLRPKELSDEHVRAVKEYCDSKSIQFLCTGHDGSVIDFLDKELDVPAFKIGSGELENWPFIEDIARRGKPIILSTGMYRTAQIKRAIDVIWAAGRPPLAILHCVTEYPAAPEAINLRVMDEIRSFFGGPVGYSDHTAGTAIPLAAVARGADIVEKHISIDFDVPNAQDWKVSCGPHNLTQFVSDIRSIESALGGDLKTLSAAEESSIRWARKSLTAACKIHAGETITRDMLVARRPGTGIPPSDIDKVLGRKARSEISPDEIIDWASLG